MNDKDRDRNNDKDKEDEENRRNRISAEDDDKNHLVLETHRDFAEATGEIFKRLNENPDVARLLLVNPALAIQELDIELSQELQHHVLHVLQHPPQLRERREELEASLTKALGQSPKPNNEKWLADILFNKLNLSPVNTTDQKPTYQRVISDSLLQYSQNINDRWESGKMNPRRSRPKGMKMRFKLPGDKIRRLDLEAPVPDDLPPLDETPTTISLEELYFYRDQNPIVKDLLEFAVIEHRAFPIQSADGYRKVKNGDQSSVFTTWIKSTTFSPPSKKG